MLKQRGDHEVRKTKIIIRTILFYPQLLPFARFPPVLRCSIFVATRGRCWRWKVTANLPEHAATTWTLTQLDCWDRLVPKHSGGRSSTADWESWRQPQQDLATAAAAAAAWFLHVAPQLNAEPPARSLRAQREHVTISVQTPHGSTSRCHTRRIKPLRREGAEAWPGSLHTVQEVWLKST